MTAEALALSGSYADQAYERVLDRVVMLDIRPGEPIDDDRLATEFGFGRTPVREALKRLERERLVVAYPTARHICDGGGHDRLGGHLRNPQTTRTHRGGPRGPDGPAGGSGPAFGVGRGDPDVQ